MKRIIFGIAAVMVSSGALAQSAVVPPTPSPTIAAPPSNEEARLPRPPRARGIPTALAAEAGLAAVASCIANGYKVTALVTDSAAVPTVLISGEGAAAITQRVAMSKAQAVIKYKMTSGAVTAKAAADPAFMAQLLADPLIGTPRQGAIPIMVGSDLVGTFAVSGAPGGDKDELCAQAGLAKIQDRIH